MMVELWIRKREMGDEDGNNVEDRSGYEKSRVLLCLIGLGRPRIGVLTRRIGIRTCCIGDGKLTCTETSLK